MSLSFTELERARLPAAALGRLAAQRCANGVEIALADRDLWVQWLPGDDAVARSLMPITGCRLYGRREGRWHGWGQTLPAFDVPESLRFRPLWQVIFPAAVKPLSAEEFAPAATKLMLVADQAFRPTQALLATLHDVLAWAETVPPCALERYQGVIQLDRLFLLGRKLPWLDHGERFWGQSVFVPIGYRPRPCLAAADLRRALGIADTDVAILRADRGEVIARDRFAPLSHAALRLAAREEAR